MWHALKVLKAGSRGVNLDKGAPAETKCGKRLHWEIGGGKHLEFSRKRMEYHQGSVWQYETSQGTRGLGKEVC